MAVDIWLLSILVALANNSNLTPPLPMYSSLLHAMVEEPIGVQSDMNILLAIDGHSYVYDRDTSCYKVIIYNVHIHTYNVMKVSYCNIL